MRLTRILVIILIAVVITLTMNLLMGGVLALLQIAWYGQGRGFWLGVAGGQNPTSIWQFPNGFSLAPVFAILLAGYAALAKSKNAIVATMVVGMGTVVLGLAIGTSFGSQPLSAMWVTGWISRVLVIFVLSAYLTRRLANYIPLSKERHRSRQSLSGGFTLIEVLVVTAILALLAALLFPVFARAKRSSLIATDMAQMRQTYLAIKLYQEDEGELPPLLTSLVPRYIPKAILRGAGDPRLPRNDGTYIAFTPCNKWREEIADCPRSSYMVSYAYLSTFRRTIEKQGIVFAELEARPNMGLLTAMHHADHTSSTALFSVSDPSLGKRHNTGLYLRTYMDGSTKAISKKATGGSWDCSWESCFLD